MILLFCGGTDKWIGWDPDDIRTEKLGPCSFAMSDIGRSASWLHASSVQEPPVTFQDHTCDGETVGACIRDQGGQTRLEKEGAIHTKRAVLDANLVSTSFSLLLQDSNRA